MSQWALWDLDKDQTLQPETFQWKILERARMLGQTTETQTQLVDKDAPMHLLDNGFELELDKNVT